MAHHQIEVAPGGLIEVVHGGQARRPTRQQLQRPERLQRRHAAHRFAGMVGHVQGVAVVALGIAQASTSRSMALSLILPSVCRDQLPSGVDVLLAGGAVLPELVALGLARQAQALSEKLLNERGRQAVSEAHHHGGAFLGAGEQAGFLATVGTGNGRLCRIGSAGMGSPWLIVAPGR